VPLVFYAFGWAFNLAGTENQVKLVFWAAIAVTFTVDFLLAMIISNNTKMPSNDGTQYDALESEPLVFIICSWIPCVRDLISCSDSCCGNGIRKNHHNLKKIIRHSRGHQDIESKTGDVAAMKKTIAEYREDISTVNRT